MTTLRITYSEDFRKNEISRVVYARLRGIGVDPENVNSSYGVNRGIFCVDYVLPSRNFLPIKSELEVKFKDLNLISIEVK